MKEDNKIVLITGASSGIGRETAFLFAQANYNLIITYYLNQKGGEETKAKCLEMGARSVFLLNLNLADQENIKQTVNQIVKRYGKIDILINNAGSMKKGFLKDQAEQEINEQIQTNLQGTILMTKFCLAYLTQAIVNIGSTLSFEAKKELSIYSAAKFGLRGFSLALAKELDKIKVYLIHPGLTNTQMGNAQGIHPKKVAEIIFKTTIGDYGLKSGSEIRVRDYIYGKFWSRLIKLARFFKSLL